MNLLKRLKDLNLRIKFVLPISVMLAISIVLISNYLLMLQSEGFRRELETSGETMIRMLAINAESGVLFESEYVLDELLEVVKSFDQVEFAVIVNMDGYPISRTGTIEVNADEWSIEGLRDSLDESLKKQYAVDSVGRNLLLLTFPVTTYREVVSRENLGVTGGVGQTVPSTQRAEIIGHIVLGLSLEKVDASIHEGRIAIILFSLAVLIIAIAIVMFIVGAITHPIEELVTISDKISKGDLSQKVEIDQEDEIGQLARTFNQMIESLKLSRDEIEQYNRNLEEKIIERTRQLEEAQSQLIQSEKMSAVGQLAAGVAHELNNPLGGILGYAQFTLEKLKKNNKGATTEKEINSYIKYVTDIEIQARRCKAIVQNLLKFSRSSRRSDFVDVDINAAIEETVNFVEHQLRINQIELENSLSSDLPMILGNIGQLQQVFTNLIINAMHASKRGSTVTIQTRYSPPLGEFSGAVEILVIDQGHGVSTENMKKIFEPFFTTKEVGKGTGLGLSVSYGIIREHGGEIQVESEEDIGTTFTIVLPVQKSMSPADTKTEHDQTLLSE